MSDAPTLLLAVASFTIEKLDEIVTPASVVSDNDTEKLLSLSCFFWSPPLSGDSTSIPTWWLPS